MKISAKHAGLGTLARGTTHFYEINKVQNQGDYLTSNSRVHSISNLPPKLVQENKKDILYQIKHTGQNNSHINEMRAICQI